MKYGGNDGFMTKWYDELIYHGDLLDYIQGNISLLGVVDSYFKVHGGTYCDRSIFHEDSQIIKKDYSLKIYPNNKFCYDCCWFHRNSPYYYSFYVLENKKIYKCMGCGQGGSVFEFIMDAYVININEATEVLAAILKILDYKLLDERSRNVYDEVMLYYGKQDEYFKISERKTAYLSDRVERYLNNMDDLSEIDFRKVANRLCCSEDFVRDKYYKTDYYKVKQLIKLKEDERYYFK